jgi:hypothetical protein
MLAHNNTNERVIRFITHLVLDLNDSETVYAGTFGHSLFVSYDGGQTWN